MELSLPQKLQPLINIHEARPGVLGGAGLNRDTIYDIVVHRPDHPRNRLDVEDIKEGVHGFPDLEFISIRPSIHLGCNQYATWPLQHSQREIFGQSSWKPVVIRDQQRRNPMVILSSPCVWLLVA